MTELNKQHAQELNYSFLLLAMETIYIVAIYTDYRNILNVCGSNKLNNIFSRRILELV